jgi:Ca2+-binding RTX toxin-like protein
VTAGAGRNIVTSGSGNDTITTGAGNDKIAAGDGNNTVTAGDGTNIVTTGSGNDTITTGAGADNVDSAGGNDIITTGGGRDVINAGAGDDTVNAGTGDDRITPGAGIDTLTGGGGRDSFIYDSLATALLGADTISDFVTSSPNAGEGDVLNLVGLVNGFTDLSGETLTQLVASGHLDFSGNSTNTVISFDSNGSAAGGSTGVLVTLVGVGFTSEANSLIDFADNILVLG